MSAVPRCSWQHHQTAKHKSNTYYDVTVAAASLLTALGVFCGGGNRVGGSGGLTGGRQMACFSGDLVLFGPLLSPEKQEKLHFVMCRNWEFAIEL